MSDVKSERDTGPPLADPPPSLEMQRKLARTITDPSNQAVHAVAQWSRLTGTPFDRGLFLELEAQIADIRDGNLDRPATILAAHLETLSATFFELMRSSYEYRGTPRSDEMLKLALRVQARIDASIRTLADLTNPRPVAYVQQANIGNAVQVNNHSSRSVVTESLPNKLLEKQPNEWMDQRAAKAPIAADSQMATVGAVNRPPYPRR